MVTEQAFVTLATVSMLAFIVCVCSSNAAHNVSLDADWLCCRRVAWLYFFNPHGTTFVALTRRIVFLNILPGEVGRNYVQFVEHVCVHASTATYAVLLASWWFCCSRTMISDSIRLRPFFQLDGACFCCLILCSH